MAEPLCQFCLYCRGIVNHSPKFMLPLRTILVNCVQYKLGGTLNIQDTLCRFCTCTLPLRFFQDIFSALNSTEILHSSVWSFPFSCNFCSYCTTYKKYSAVFSKIFWNVQNYYNVCKTICIIWIEKKEKLSSCWVEGSGYCEWPGKWSRYTNKVLISLIVSVSHPN